jgi:hypothetical protein
MIVQASVWHGKASLMAKPLWGIAAATVVGFAWVLGSLSHQFAPDINMSARPILLLVAFLVAANAAAAAFLPRLVYRSADLRLDQTRSIMILILLSGLIARLILFSSQPILENDYQRYLWDGAATAHGYNPFEFSPATISRDGQAGPFAQLAEEGRATLGRIGHKELTTIYPPIAQGAFAVAHLIAPWSLNAWRLLLLVGDGATLLLLAKFLDATGRTRLWVSLYWLNPLVLKEAFNSGHMEPILLPLVLLAILFAWQRRPALTSAALAFAAGVKLWPAILAPLLFRIFEKKKAQLILPATMLLCAMALWLALMIASSNVETSGLVAYAENWKTNSALYPALASAIDVVMGKFTSGRLEAGQMARGLIAMLLLLVALRAAAGTGRTLDDLVARTSTIVAALVLLSPAQYPWYALWFAPFAVFYPSPAFRVAMTTLPLYYTSFYFAAQDRPEIFTDYVVWLIWVPVWTAAAWEFRRRGASAETTLLSKEPA